MNLLIIKKSSQANETMTIYIYLKQTNIKDLNRYFFSTVSIANFHKKCHIYVCVFYDPKINKKNHIYHRKDTIKLLIFVACVPETIGDNCTINCHCVNQPCDHEDGTCPAGGCQRGYEGINCSIGM